MITFVLTKHLEPGNSFLFSRDRKIGLVIASLKVSRGFNRKLTILSSSGNVFVWYSGIEATWEVLFR